MKLAIAPMLIICLMLPFACARAPAEEELMEEEEEVLPVRIDRGPVFLAVEQTLAKPGPVKDDLIKRGLVIYDIDPETGNVRSGTIKVGAIEKLVEAGVYAIDDEFNLIFGPNYISP